MEEKNNKGANFGVTIFLILLTGLLLFFSVKQKIDLEKNKEDFSKRISQEVTDSVKKEISNAINERQGERPKFSDYDAIKGDNLDLKIKNIEISSDCPDSGCLNNKSATLDFDGIKKSYIVEGKFSRAYLFIDALVDYNRPLTSWDDIYFTINEMGGHLIPDVNLLPVPISDSSRYLYNLNSISYFPKIQDKENNKNKKSDMNFFWMLQNGNDLNIHVSISSNRPGRNMKEVSIFYECFEGSDCLIREIKK